MSGLQNFLAPFSHLLFANRNVVIVLLCAGLFWVALDALIHRWRATRLETDLAHAKSGASSPTGRRYVTAAAVEEAPAESGALPPVKGGRTYARNLGSALHKAGMSGPQIYSPPTPPGWAPTTNPGQAAPQQPGMAQPYAAPNVPWGAPAQQPPAPWAYPPGAGRGVPGQPPIPAPYYQPPAPAQPQPPTAMPQPSMPQAPASSPFAPPSGPFGQPAYPAPTSGPTAPQFAPPGFPMAPAGAPPFQAPAPGQTGGEPAGPDSGRRGKPKRRRFNFNVLENLEKMVQAKPAEAQPSTGWTPPVTPPPAPPTAAPAVSSIAGAPTPPQPTAEESLPLQFGSPAQPKPSAETEAGVAEPTAPPELEIEQTSVTYEPEVAEPETKEAELEPAPEPEPEQEPAAEPEAKTEPHRSMRSMLFGEESMPAPFAAAPSEAEPASSAPAPEPEPASAESSWPSYPWMQDQSSSATESETPAPAASRTEDVAAEPEVEAPAETTPEPIAEPAGSRAFDPWRSTVDTEEPTPVVATSQPAEPPAEVPAGPVEADSNGSGAGTIVIIEDDQTAASYYATLFRGNGYRVEVANDGVSGVDLCARMQPQVILLDVMMPRQNGILVLQTLRASDETKSTPVVVMSNFSEPTLIKRALQLGALEYVIKTQVEGPALLNALPRWMNREKAFAAA
jgi:CheY-like chemotaxis protein